MNKICAIHQPDLFPWLGFFYKMKHCDKFVIHDDCLLSKKTVTRRVTMNSYDGEWWLTIPTENKSTMINETHISNNTNWREKIEARIIHSYKKTDFFEEYKNKFLDCLYYDNDNLAEYNLYGIKQIMNILDLKTELILSSNLNLLSVATQKEIDTLKSIDCSVYLSGNGAKAYQEDKLFEENKLKLIYSSFKPQEYKQIHGAFLMGLSTWDILFNLGAEEANKHLV